MLTDFIISKMDNAVVEISGDAMKDHFMRKYHVLLAHPCSHTSLKSESSISALIEKSHIRREGLNVKWI
jgi:hypothetical protein